VTARDCPPLTGPEVGMLELWLDATTSPHLDTATARRLLATLRRREAELAAREADADTAWSLLCADLRADADAPRLPGDFGNDPATDFPEAP